MARSERALLAVIGASVAVLASCNLITGLGDFEEVDCAGDCGALPDGSPGDEHALDAGPRDASDGGTPRVDAEAAAPPVNERLWARWKMPNPKDAEVAVNVASYAVDDAGVVTDEVTMLKWQQEPSGPLAFADALTYCQGAWRLPTRIELASLIDYTQSPALDPGAFPDAAVDVPYLTASVVSGTDASLAWSVEFGVGVVSSTDRTPTRRVRCVQGVTP
jgi:hypothetical protein